MGEVELGGRDLFIETELLEINATLGQVLMGKIVLPVLAGRWISISFLPLVVGADPVEHFLLGWL